MNRFDVIIVGAGMAGMTLALALNQGGLKVALVEKDVLASHLDQAYDGRASAIAYACFRQWKALGLGDVLEKDACRMDEIIVNDGYLPGPASKTALPFYLHFLSQDISSRSDNEPLGYMVENRATRQALYQAIVARDIALFAPAEIEDADTTQTLARLSLKSGETLSAPLIVSAEGRGSRLRKEAGIEHIGWDYGQSAIVATVQMQRPHNQKAYEYFLPSGPFAILPLTHNRACIVWSESHAKAKALLAMGDDLFHAHLMRRFGEFAGEVRVVGKRFIYPLSLGLATSMIGPRLALLGDAAHGIHPIAGQGLNLGLKDVAALAQVLIEAARLGEDIGSSLVLQRYQQWRRFDNVSTSVIMDGFVRLYSNNNPILRRLRGVGMGMVQGFDPLRRFFMEDAGAATGDLPKLLRGETI